MFCSHLNSGVQNTCMRREKSAKKGNAKGKKQRKYKLVFYLCTGESTPCISSLFYLRGTTSKECTPPHTYSMAVGITPLSC
mmetsp:Transcript_37777/g.97472  ORF Transcript_37777/g.97472 Transcript_37777/m.97472 type:complete len:81 (-) Transcript_37777:896-1138(-)